MNDYLLGTIDCCYILTDSPEEFVEAIKKSTSLTDKGIKHQEYVQRLIRQKEHATRQLFRIRIATATARAKAVLKKGDVISVTKCPGTVRWVVFDHFYGDEIISKSGRGEYFAGNITKVNGRNVDFNKET